MSDYTKIVIEADASGRMSISAVDDRGVGHGFRLAGGKYDGSNPPLIARAVLDRRAVDAIRSYLAAWDEIQVAD